MFTFNIFIRLGEVVYVADYLYREMIAEAQKSEQIITRFRKSLICNFWLNQREGARISIIFLFVLFL